MAIRRRLALVLTTVLVCSTAFIAAAVATEARLGAAPALEQGKGDGFLTAGNYNFHSMRAGFHWSSEDRSQGIDMFVTRDISVASPLHAQPYTTDVTNLFLQVFTESGGFNVCAFLDNPADFTVSSNLQAASLHTTFAANTFTCDGGTLASDVTLDVSWTGAGPIQNDSGTNHFSCAGYSTESTTTFDSNGANAILSLSDREGSFSASEQLIGTSSALEHVQGTLPPLTCQGSVGKGAGRQNPAAGTYHNTLIEASTSIFPEDGSQPQLFLIVHRTVNASGPTSTDQTTVQLFVSSETISGNACFIPAPGDFTFNSDLSGASLHTALTDASTLCPGFPNDFGSLHIDATWAGTGPVATTRGNDRFSCLRYRVVTNAVQQVNNGGTATVTIEGLPTITGPSGLGSSDTRITAIGAADPTCGFRG